MWSTDGPSSPPLGQTEDPEPPAATPASSGQSILVPRHISYLRQRACKYPVLIRPPTRRIATSEAGCNATGPIAQTARQLASHAEASAESPRELRSFESRKDRQPLDRKHAKVSRDEGKPKDPLAETGPPAPYSVLSKELPETPRERRSPIVRTAPPRSCGRRPPACIARRRPKPRRLSGAPRPESRDEPATLLFPLPDS